MSDLKKYLEMCKEYNFEGAKEYLVNQKIDSFEEACFNIDDLFKKVNFKELKINKKKLRDGFFQSLCTYFNDNKITSYIEGKLDILRYLEKAFQEVADVRNRHNFYRNDNNLIIKYLLSSFENILSRKLYDLNTSDKKLKLEQNLEKGNEIDKILLIFSDVLTLNLKFIAHSEKWFDNNLLLLPDNVVIENEKCLVDNECLEFVIMITKIWIFIEDKYTEWRYLDSEINIHDVQELRKNLNEDVFRELSRKHNTYLHCNISPIHPYAYIAQQRLTRMVNNQSIQAHQILSCSKKAMGIEDIEINVSISTLCNILHVEPTTKFGELSIKEWVVCFFSLNMEARNKSRQRLYTYEDFRSIFPKILTNAQIDYFINIMSFKRNSLDIFDAPLIKTYSGKIIFLSEFWYAINYINTFLSVTGKNKINVDKKGKLFENRVVKLFNKQSDLGLKVFKIKKNIKNEDFEYDAIVIWEEYVFIIECKNRSIVDHTTISMKNFVEKMDEYIHQVKRLEGFYKSNIRIFNEESKVDLTGKKVVPIVLNALPFSLDSDIDGVYFLDYSIVSKFFETRFLGHRNVKTNELEEIVHSWWSESLPTAEDFYKVIIAPYQVTSELNNVKESYNFWAMDSFLFLRGMISLESKPMIELKSSSLE